MGYSRLEPDFTKRSAFWRKATTHLDARLTVSEKPTSVLVSFIRVSLTVVLLDTLSLSLFSPYHSLSLYYQGYSSLSQALFPLSPSLGEASSLSCKWKSQSLVLILQLNIVNILSPHHFGAGMSP